MNIALCDDESPELEYLQRLVSEYGRQNKHPFAISCFQSGVELLSSMGQGQEYDVIFLDVFMSPLNGVLTARKIREFNDKCSIIFATGSHDHALDGYGVKAIQYLVKPIAADALGQALDQAIASQVAIIPKAVNIKTRQGSHSILLEDIIFAESAARVIPIHPPSQEPMHFYERLDTFALRCKDERFLRCHKSFLVNLDYVRSIEHGNIIMKTGQRIPVSINIPRAKEIFASYVASKI